ncbi:hypothetical protein L810_5860 [Burkholderia sp. AU4i]|uniref:hypothetical protein n=1 Tax=Burkholderia sp. AU4i TaxID=1335308 RepID=UPI000398B70E|nr:hypothetical protein [Burkholderia sp. AU4i]ERJ39507.1 hypothetical protein L810_5860 [Burkholderia sp. AU4i]
MARLSAFPLGEIVRRRRSAAMAVRDQKNKLANVWLFDSPKMNERQVISGDVPFMHAVLLEADPAVAGYFFRDRIAQNGGRAGTQDMWVYYADGRHEVWRFVDAARQPTMPNPNDAHGERGADVESNIVLKAGEALESQAIRFDNVLHLCGFVNRARSCTAWHEARLAVKRLEAGKPFKLIDTLQQDNVDPAVMLGLLGHYILNGELQVDLATQLLGRLSELRPAQHDPGRASDVAPAIALPSIDSVDAPDSEHRCEGLKIRSARGRPRCIVSAEHRDFTRWPDVDDLTLTFLSETDREMFKSRRWAVQLAIEGVEYDVIYLWTRCAAPAVRYWTKRCLLPDGAGGIVGFPALMRGYRVGYTRTKSVEVQQGSGSAGYAGVFGQVLERYEDLAEFIKDRLFPDGSERLPEKRVPYRSIWIDFKLALRERGVGDGDWPFKTDNQGEKAVREYCKELEENYPLLARRARLSADAARRADGRGPSPLIRAQRVGSFMQLDFHFTDAIGCLIFEDARKVQHRIPVARFYIGLMCDESNQSVYGFNAVLRPAPTAQNVLEIVDSAIRTDPVDSGHPFFRYAPDGSYLIGALIPEVRRSGFTVLRMDRAWCNTCADVTNNLMDVLGCAINFGPARAWWARAIIERINGTLTRRGVQRVPSTLGSGPTDGRRDDPVGKATRYEIKVSDLIAIIVGEIRHHNMQTNEGLHNASPEQLVRAAVDFPEQPYLPQPLPQRKDDWMFFAHLEEARITGRAAKGEQPSVKIHGIRCTYRSRDFADKPWLIGKPIKVYVDLRDIRHAVGFIPDIKQSVELVPERKWREYRVSWSDALLIARDRRIRRGDDEYRAVVSIYQEEQMKALAQAAKTKRGAMSAKNLALDAARYELNEKKQGENPEPTVEEGWQSSIDLVKALGISIIPITGRN